MPRDNPISRRTAMKMTGAAAATAFVAGCSDNGEEEEEENGDGDDEETFDIEPGTTIDLYGDTNGWVGVEPAEIEDEENPTLVLQEGEEYEIGWSEGDGLQHNIEIRDDGGAVVDDYATETTMEEEPEDQFLTFTATEEMAAYVCEPHDAAMNGDLIVE